MTYKLRILVEMAQNTTSTYFAYGGCSFQYQRYVPLHYLHSYVHNSCTFSDFCDVQEPYPPVVVLHSCSRAS